MKTVYTITRYNNGWAVDTSTGDSMKNYSAVYEDPEQQEEVAARQESLIALLGNTFVELEDIEFHFYEEGEENEDEGEETNGDDGQEREAG